MITSTTLPLDNSIYLILSPLLSWPAYKINNFPPQLIWHEFTVVAHRRLKCSEKDYTFRTGVIYQQKNKYHGFVSRPIRDSIFY